MFPVISVAGAAHLSVGREKMTLPSFHDDNIVGYCVDCQARTISMQIMAPHWKNGNTRTLLFNGVAGYHFKDDAFGNIVLDIEEIAVDLFIAEYANEIAESFRISGAFGTWAKDLSSAPQVLSEKGVRGFVFSASIGMSGWVLAREAVVIPAQQGAPADVGANAPSRQS